MPNFFRRRELRKKAERLVAVARVVAVSSTTYVLDNLSTIARFIEAGGGKAIESLDLHIGTACVGVGLMTASVSREDASEFLLQTVAALQRWKSATPDLLSSFQNEALKGIADPQKAAPSIGFWIVRHIGLEDSSCIPRVEGIALGFLVLRTMGSWD